MEIFEKFIQKNSPPSLTFDNFDDQYEQIIANKFNSYFDSVSLINQSINESDELKQPINDNSTFNTFQPIIFTHFKNVFVSSSNERLILIMCLLKLFKIYFFVNGGVYLA